MNRKLYIVVLLLTGQQLVAQVPEDALRMSWNAPSGTARNQAIGGAMGSLGGEISAVFVNPAGLGMYKTGEIVLSPGLSFFKTKSNYRETDATSGKLSRFNLGTSGIIWAFSDKYSKWSSKAFSIAVNRTANFNNTIYYKGLNNFSSFSESFAEELARSGVAIDDVFASPLLSLGTKMAVYTYLIDTARVGGDLQVVGRPEYLDAVTQEKTIKTKGGITEVALAYAANMDDRIFIGGTLGIPIVNYEQTSTFLEADASNDDDNDFAFSRFEEKYKSTGVGVNAKLGIIIKPADQFRIGFALHTPTLYGLRNEQTGKMVTDLEGLFGPNDPGIDSVTSDYYYGNDAPVYKYNLVSPWKFMLSGSYVIREISDVTKQKGFITADVEYVTYSSSRFSAVDEQTDDSYFRDVNAATKSIYKGALNFRAGGELKFNTIMARLGFAYMSNPYKDKELKARKMNLSGGLGYRNKGIFIDLTYVHGLNKDVNFPYRIADKANTYAITKDGTKNVLLTVGFKF